MACLLTTRLPIHRLLPLPISSFSTPRRWFAVKEIDWCSSQKKTNKGHTKRNSNKLLPSKSLPPQPPPPPDRFGVVAAISRNFVIGLNGQLPWSIPEDTNHFLNVTRDKVVIMGRTSFEETECASHLSHVRWKILISTTASAADYDDGVVTKLKIARSFGEALGIARQLAEEDGREGGLSTEEEEVVPEKSESSSTAVSALDCWVAGGERIYEEAMRHDSAEELYLTRVDTHIDIDIDSNEDSIDKHTTTTIARFPLAYRWDNKFVEVTNWEGDESTGDGLRHAVHVYQRKRRQRK